MTATAGRPATSLLARVYSRLSDRYQTIGQVAKDDSTDAVARALRELVDDGLVERDGARWRRRQGPPARQAPEPTPAAELPPEPEPAPPPEPAAVVLPDLADTVQAAARSRLWWTRSELATSVEIRTNNGYRRAAIEVEIARQLDDGRLHTDKLGTLVGAQPAAEPRVTPHAAPAGDTTEAVPPSAEVERARLPAQPAPPARPTPAAQAAQAARPTARSALLALVQAEPGIEIHAAADRIGVSWSRVRQLSVALGLVCKPSQQQREGRGGNNALALYPWDSDGAPAARSGQVTRAQILEVCREHPGLTSTELGRRVNRTPERVRQVALTLGLQRVDGRWYPPAGPEAAQATPEPTAPAGAAPGSANTTTAPSTAPAEDLQSGDPTDRAQHGASSDTPHPPPPVGPATSGEDAAPCKPEADGSGVLADQDEPLRARSAAGDTTPASPEAAEGAAPASAGVLPEPEVVRIERDPTPVDVGLTLAARVGELEAALTEAKDDADQFAAEARVARAALRDDLRQVHRDLAEARAALSVLDLVLAPAERELPAAARAGLVVGQLQILRGGM